MKPKFKRGLKVAGVVVALAAVFAMAYPKGASAAAQVVSSMIKDQTIQSRDIAAGGVGTSELRDGNTYFKDLSKGTQDLINSKASKTQAQGYADKAESDAKGHANEVAQDAENAAKGYADANDDKGLNTSRAGAGYTTTAPEGVSVLFNKCDVDGQVAISGGYRLNGHAAEAFQGGGAPVDGLSVIATEPVGVVGDKIVNTYQHPDFPQTEDGGFQANAWAVTFNNTSGSPKDVRVYATCVSVN